MPTCHGGLYSNDEDDQSDIVQIDGFDSVIFDTSSDSVDPLTEAATAAMKPIVRTHPNQTLVTIIVMAKMQLSH